MKAAAKAWTVIRLSWMERVVHRANFLLEVASGILSAAILVLVWMAVYRCAPGPLIRGYSIQEMVTYILGGGLIGTSILTAAIHQESSHSIQTGSFSLLLLQPLNPYWYWLWRDAASKLFSLALGIAGYAAVCLFFRGLIVPPAGTGALALFLAALVLASALHFLLFQAASLLAFWMENTFGVRFTLRVVLEVIGGAAIPISFFPEALQAIFLSLPFPYLIYLPLRIYLGKVEAGEAMGQLGIEVLWIGALALVNRALWKRGLARYVAMGD